MDTERYEFIEKRSAEIRSELSRKGLPFIHSIVVAGDLAHAEYIEEKMKDGTITDDPVKVSSYIGSYARFEFAKRHFDKDTFFRMLPELWVGSDPDDGIDAFEIWEEAYNRLGKVVIDRRKLPFDKTFTIYRGQLPGDLGISWSLRRDVALKFAMSGGMRARVNNGELYIGRVNREDIKAYLTARGEAEIIVHPDKVMIVDVESL